MVKTINIMGKTNKVVPMNVTVINRPNLMSSFHGTLMGILSVVSGTIFFLHYSVIKCLTWPLSVLIGIQPV